MTLEEQYSGIVCESSKKQFKLANVTTYLNNIKAKYDSLSSTILSLKSRDNRVMVLEMIDNVELNTLRTHNLMDLVTRLFGCQFFIMISYAFSIGVEYCLYTYNFRIVGVTPLYTILVAPIFVCIYACDITQKAARKLTSNLLAASNHFADDPEIYEKLKDVSFKVGLMHNNFTAARFLNVDRKIAFSILSAVGTYFLVIQQMYLPRERSFHNNTNT